MWPAPYSGRMPPVPAHAEPAATEPHRRRRAPLLLALALALLLQLVVLYLPGQAVPSAGFEVPGLDKAIHAAIFAAPAALISAARLPAGWLVPLAAHAPVSEVLQLTLVPHRSADPWDVAADLTGVALGAAVGRAMRRWAVPGGGRRRGCRATRLEDRARQEYASTVSSSRGHDLGL